VTVEFLLKVSTAQQLNSAAGRLFHSSTILLEKNIYVYPNEPVVYII